MICLNGDSSPSPFKTFNIVSHLLFYFMYLMVILSCDLCKYCHVCSRMHVCAFVYACESVCTCVGACMRVYVRACVRTCMRTQMDGCVYEILHYYTLATELLTCLRKTLRGQYCGVCLRDMKHPAAPHAVVVIGETPQCFRSIWPI